MWHIGKIFSFAWAYLKPYRGRLFLGILASFIYAASNGGFVWLTRAFTERFETMSPGLVVTNTVTTILVTKNPGDRIANTNVLVANYFTTDQVAAAKPEPRKTPKLIGALTDAVNKIGAAVKEAADPWLPRMGTPVTWRHIVTMLLVVPLVAVVRGTMNYSSNYCLQWASQRGIRDLRLDLMAKLSSLSLDYFTRAKTGDLLTRVNNDTATIARAFASSGPDLLKESTTLLVTFAVLLSMDWKLTIVAMIILPLCAVPLIVLGGKTRRASKTGRAIDVVQTSQLVEFIAGIRVIKAYNLEASQIERFRVRSGDLVRSSMKVVQSKESVNPLIEVVSAIGLGVLLLYIFMTNRDASTLPAFVVSFLFFFNSLRKLAGVHMVYEQAHISVDRLLDLMQEKPKVVEPASPKPFNDFKNAITFEGIGFGYVDATVLHNIDLKIPCGFKLGIAGSSGSGKTTLVNLLFRFYDPTKGAVKIDGQDLRDFSLRELRQQMALVSQDIVLFDETVAQNIAQGRSDATREEIEQAARSAFAHDFIVKLPQGYDTIVGERGVTLSTGQKQRVCIARAFVRNAPILVLDEATASLDTKAEAEVQVAIDKLTQDRTVVCIAHRLATLASMDRIIVLNDGKIIEQGSYQELLRQGGLFAEMAVGQGIFPSPKSI